MSELSHTPVLLAETLDHLNLRAGSQVIDCTLGLGGHSEAILKKIGPKGRLLVFEQDETNLAFAKERLRPFAKQVTYADTNFENLRQVVKDEKFGPVDAILFDLGLSSPHVDDAERGFSFMKDGPLDMRFDKRQKLTAEMVVNSYTEKELADIIYEFGEERRSRQIASKIVRARKIKRIKTTAELANLIAGEHRKKGFHPATLTFQALRIYVNRETEVLSSALDDAIDLLAPKGRLAVISYHSLEDRLVKNKFRDATKDCICPKENPVCQCKIPKKLYLLTKKPIIPSGIEVFGNPRSRSAKLRVAEKL